jgi:hypothetical protein
MLFLFSKNSRPIKRQVQVLLGLFSKIAALRDSGARVAEEFKKFGGDSDVPVIRAIQEYGRSFAEIESSREKMVQFFSSYM